MDFPIGQVEDWIKSNSNQSFLISKEEDGDLDQIKMNIHSVSLDSRRHVDPDGYVAGQAIFLHGEGAFMNGAPLPQNIYEIPLFGTWITQERDNQMHIQTERAVYTIQTSH